MSAHAWGWRLFLGWARWPWHGWRPRRLAAPMVIGGDDTTATRGRPRWWKVIRFPGPVETYHAALSLGWGHIWITLGRSAR